MNYYHLIWLFVIILLPLHGISCSAELKTLAKGKTFIRIRQEISKKKDYTHIKIYCLWQKNNQL